MKHSLFITIASSLLLAACYPSGQPGDKLPPEQKISDWQSYSNTAFNYSIDIPLVAYIPNKTTTGAQIFFGNIPFMQKGAKGNEFDVLLYGQKAARCSPSLTGASETTPLSNAGGKAEWGQVDFFEQYGGNGYVDYEGTPPVCAQGEAKGRYAFCSEKDGKTVVICINQMTRNEELAKQIFETFRWVD